MMHGNRSAQQIQHFTCDLCLVAQHGDLVRGIADSSANLFHKGEVMRLMNSRLLDGSYKVTDADITSIALLVILEVRKGYLNL
jgi:hypothetical protein